MSSSPAPRTMTSQDFTRRLYESAASLAGRGGRGRFQFGLHHEPFRCRADVIRGIAGDQSQLCVRRWSQYPGGGGIDDELLRHPVVKGLAIPLDQQFVAGSQFVDVAKER